jgi:hypothetical protein
MAAMQAALGLYVHVSLQNSLEVSPWFRKHYVYVSLEV